MNEFVPVDVADVSTAAGANETHGHNGAFLFFFVNELAPRQGFAAN